MCIKNSTATKNHWSNKENSIFYECISIQDMENFAKKAGLDDCCDMNILDEIIGKSKNILELGAGYGRILSFLLEKYTPTRITGVERSNRLFSFLKTRFNDEVNLLNVDLQTFNFNNETFDLILFMWSGIADFHVEEQKKIIKKAKKLLTKNGTLIIDTLSEKQPPLGMTKLENERDYKQLYKDTNIYTHSLSIEEINQFAKLAKFKKVTHIPYLTKTNRSRALHILS